MSIDSTRFERLTIPSGGFPVGQLSVWAGLARPVTEHKSNIGLHLAARAAAEGRSMRDGLFIDPSPSQAEFLRRMTMTPVHHLAREQAARRWPELPPFVRTKQVMDSVAFRLHAQWHKAHSREWHEDFAVLAQQACLTAHW